MIRANLMTRATFWLLFTLLLSACGPAHHARGRLKDSARDFNVMVRWKKWQPASGYVEGSKRAHWLATRMQGDASLRMMDVQLLAVKSTGEDTAEVQVAVMYTRAPQITVERRIFVQKWKKIKEMWMMTDELPVTVDENTAPLPSWP